jgi:hypothetical protein
VARFLDDDVEDLLRAEAAAVPEQALDAVVVALLVEPRAVDLAVAARDAPAGQRTGGLADVALVVALGEREELHELAGVVLVRRVLVGVGEREEELHRRVARDLPQQPRERAHAVLAQHPVLAQHERRVLIARGEVVVPEERELLLQRPRRSHHPVEPPQDVVAVLVEGIDRPALDRGARAEQRRAALRTVDDVRDRSSSAGTRPVPDLLRCGAETRAPEEAADVGLRPCPCVASHAVQVPSASPRGSLSPDPPRLSIRVAQERWSSRARGRTASRTAREPPAPTCHHPTMTTFHHTWIVEVELEVTNPQEGCAQRIFDALVAYGCDDTEPYPTQVAREDGRWLEVSLPVWAPSQFAAIAAGAATLADACGRVGADVGVARIAAAESSRGHEAYRERVRDMEAAAS